MKKGNNIFLFFFIALVIIFIFFMLQKKSNYVSHTFEPKVGDEVLNNNKNCKHFKSCGVVVGIQGLDNDMGKVIEYRVTNDGNTYKKGDTLRKTMDQLCPKKF